MHCLFEMRKEEKNACSKGRWSGCRFECVILSSYKMRVPHVYFLFVVCCSVLFSLDGIAERTRCANDARIKFDESEYQFVVYPFFFVLSLGSDFFFLKAILWCGSVSQWANGRTVINSAVRPLSDYPPVFITSGIEKNFLCITDGHSENGLVNEQGVWYSKNKMELLVRRRTGRWLFTWNL